MKTKALLASLFLITTTCTDYHGNEKQKNKHLGIEVIYGEDNRIDWFEEKDEHWQQMARSTVALFDKDSLTLDLEGQSYFLETLPYGLSKQLCESEAFFAQERGSFCSGFLIGADLVVTAGPCIRNAFNCENVRFVFDFHYSEIGLAPTKALRENVYQCQTVIHTQANALTGSDFALIRLDRQVTDRAPLPLRTTGTLQPEATLTVIGYPSGLPTKLAHEGKVRNLDEAAYFTASLDTYGGNSGSAVFNGETRLVEGILFNGDTDFVFDQEQKCRVSNTCKVTGCRGEDVTRISEIFPYLTPGDLLSH